MSQIASIPIDVLGKNPASENVPKCPEKKFELGTTSLRVGSISRDDKDLSNGSEKSECPTGAQVGHSSFDDENHSLSSRQIEAIEWIINGYSDSKAAEAVGVDRRTIYRWRRSKRFMQELNHQRDDLLDEAADGLRAMLPSALEVISRQLNNQTSDHAFKAASLLLKTGLAQGILRPRPEEEKKEE